MQSYGEEFEAFVELHRAKEEQKSDLVEEK